MENNINILFLFTDLLPCWDTETIELAGDSPEPLEVLAKAGSLLRLGGGYVLTQKGLLEREEAARREYVPLEEAGRLLTDPQEAHSALELNRMVQLLDRAFMTDWGIKEFTVKESFPVVPCPADDEFFRLEGGKAVAVWPSLPVVREFLHDFPNKGYDARKLPAPGPEALDKWAEAHNAHRGTLTMDLVIRHRHDFNHYRQLYVPAGDVYKFVNAWLVFAHKVMESPEDLLPLIGKVHLFFEGQRRVYIPGWFDMDSEEQEPGKLRRDSEDIAA